MIARRLLIFALVLLVVTAISTALAPPRGLEETPPEPRPAGGSGDSVLVERSVDAADAAPPTVSLEVGDRLRLTVSSPESGAVELDGLGALKAIAPGTDAVFDVLPTRPGEYPLVLMGEERTLATVRVAGDR